jgi:hypothetical protein
MSLSGLIELIKSRSEDAGRAQSRVEYLEIEQARFPNAVERNKTDSILSQVRQALSNGQFDKISPLLDQLQFLRESDFSSARDAWLSVIALQMQFASIRGDYNAIDKIAQNADHILLKSYQRDLWSIQYELGNSYIRRAVLFGDTVSAQRALDFFESIVLPLAPQADRSSDWANTQFGIGVSEVLVGKHATVCAHQLRAVAAFDKALQVWTESIDSRRWATTHHNLGVAHLDCALRERANTHLTDAITEIDLAHRYRTRSTSPSDWASSQQVRGEALLQFAYRLNSQAYVESRLQAFSLAATIRTADRDQAEWADTQIGMVRLLLMSGSLKNETSTIRNATQRAEAVVSKLFESKFQLLPIPLVRALALSWRAKSISSRCHEVVGDDRWKIPLVSLGGDFDPDSKALGLFSRGNCYTALALQNEGGWEYVEAAVRDLRAAQKIWTVDVRPTEWAFIESNASKMEKVLRDNGQPRIQLRFQPMTASFSLRFAPTMKFRPNLLCACSTLSALRTG